MHATDRKDLPWTDIEPYFDRALQMDDPSCATWLGELDRHQPDVAKAVRALLEQRAALNAAGFLEGSAFAGVENLAPAFRDIVARHAARVTGPGGAEAKSRHGWSEGALVGPYRLIREIGVGGMSSVWLAERNDGQLKREVALKLPLTGPRMQVERFRRERDILAALTHPNIARLYDAGFSESGQPYLAMEYIAGTQLLDSCDERLLGIRERLRLFVQVMEAVQFAHAELVIHRDLKPSNILVTPQARVVLLDFGIGKLLTEETAEETELTQMSGRLFTPGYASPEQIAGQALTTASDIYSLGVVLYELLTGVRPYRLKYESRAALEEAILKVDPRRPSQNKFSPQVAAARGTTERALVRTLAGDLDTIVLKALKRNPLERYTSVSAFAQDVLNYLNNFPVSARPDSLWYRIGRFSARYKVPVAAASVATLALIGGSAVAIWQARSAAAERDRAVAFASRNEAVTEFLGRMITDAAASQKPITVSELLTRSEKMALNDASGSPENRAAVLEMIADRYVANDNGDRALPLLAHALQLVEKSPDAALRSRLTCKHAAASAGLGDSERWLQAIYAEAKRSDADPPTAALCMLKAASIHLAEERSAETLRDAQVGLEKSHQSSNGRVTEAALLGTMGYAYSLSSRVAEAERYYEQAIRKYRELGREHSDGALLVLNDWGISMLNAGVPRRALELLDESIRIEGQRGPDVELTATVLGNRGLALQALGRFEQARTEFDKECRLAISHGDEFTELHCLIGQASVSMMLGEHGDAQQLDHAQHYLDQFTQLLNQLSAPADSPPARAQLLVQSRVQLARGQLAQARSGFERVIIDRPHDSMNLDGYLGISMTALAANDAARAVEFARRAMPLAVARQGDLPHSHYVGLASLWLGRALLRAGDRVEGRKALEAAVSHLSNTIDSDNPNLLRARAELGEARLLTARAGGGEQDQQHTDR
jgi:serine/threonine protein kinase/tetratricopeptide (TPR) repeat protein